VLDSSLNDWNEELSAGSSKTLAEKHGGSLSTDVEPIPGTRDPTKSQKKGEKYLLLALTLQRSSGNKNCNKTQPSLKGKSAPKERRSDLQQSATPAQSSTTEVAALPREAFSGFVLQMNKGFSSLGASPKNDAKGDDKAPALSNPESNNNGSGQRKNLRNPLVRKQKSDDGVVLSKDNSDILTKLEKEFIVSEQDGAEIHGDLATIVQKLLKDKPEKIS